MKIRLRLLPCVVLAATAAFNAGAWAGPVSGVGTWETDLSGRLWNSSTSQFDAYYDKALDITWLADFSATGLLTWSAANNWASNLDVNGVSGWRLPKTSGFAPGDFFLPPPAISELAHLFYVTLGNKGKPNIYDPGNYPSSSTANFVGIRSNNADFGSSNYWSGTSGGYDPLTLAWYFRMGDGGQGIDFKGFSFSVVAVHDGDVGGAKPPSPIPEPTTLALVLLSLGVMMAVRPKSKWDHSVPVSG